MANNYITFQTSPDLPMQDNSVLETVAGTTFPTGFSAVTGGGTGGVMLIVNRDVLGAGPTGALTLESVVDECMQRILKKLNESVNFS